MVFPILILFFIIVISIVHNKEFFTTEEESNNNDIFDDMNVYAINLKMRPLKRRYIVNEFQKAGLIGNIIEAVDGRTLNIEKLKHDAIMPPVPTYRRLRRGEIGCYLSHLNIWKEFIQSNKKYALIFEDDAEIPTNFKQKLNEYIGEIKNVDWDIFLLTMNCERHFGEDCKQSKSVSNNVRIPKIFGYGLYGYIITKRAAEILIKKALPIEYPVDVYVLYNQLYNKDLKFVQLKIPLVLVHSYTDSDTVSIK